MHVAIAPLNRATRVLSLLVLASGCGGSSSKEQFTCDLQTAAYNTCTVSIADGTKSDDIKGACEQLGGSLTTDPCSRPDAFGTCTGKSDGIAFTTISYPSSTITTPEGAATACDNLHGTWVVNTDYTPAYSCGDSIYCAQFGALSTAQQTNASSYCEQYGLPAVTPGLCATQPSVGSCAITGDGLGNVTIFVYSGDADGDRYNCTHTFGGVWTAS